MFKAQTWVWRMRNVQLPALALHRQYLALRVSSIWVPLQMNIADREQEVMSAAGLATIGGSGTVGHGVMERVLRIIPGMLYIRPTVHFIYSPAGPEQAHLSREQAQMSLWRLKPAMPLRMAASYGVHDVHLASCVG